MKYLIYTFLIFASSNVFSQTIESARKQIILEDSKDTIAGYIQDYPLGIYDGFNIKTLAGDKIKVRPSSAKSFVIDGEKWVRLRDPSLKTMYFAIEEIVGEVSMYKKPFWINSSSTMNAPSGQLTTIYQGGGIRYLIVKNFIVYPLYRGRFKRQLKKALADKPLLFEKVNLKNSEYEMIPEIILLYNSL